VFFSIIKGPRLWGKPRFQSTGAINLALPASPVLSTFTPGSRIPRLLHIAGNSRNWPINSDELK